MHNARYKFQLTNQHWAHAVQSTVSSTKVQAKVFKMTGNLFYFGVNISELVKNPVVHRQYIVSHLTAIISSAQLSRIIF